MLAILLLVAVLAYAETVNDNGTARMTLLAPAPAHTVQLLDEGRAPVRPVHRFGYTFGGSHD